MEASLFHLPFTDPVLIFASVMLLILLAPMMARRFRLPEVVGLLVAGIMVGPHGLGILARDNTIDLLGTVGLLFIMFMAGLEIDLIQVGRNKTHTVVHGLTTFIVPLVMGTVLGISIFEMSIPVALLLASMISSHTLVTYPIVNKLGLSRSPSVTTAIGGTIITDTLALLILAIVAASSTGEITAYFWLRLFISILVYVSAVIIVIPRLARWFFRSLDVDENVEFVFVIAIAFLIAFLAHLAHLEPIIGAFLAGLIFNSFIPEKSLLMTRIRFAGDALFIPFFLLSVGMLVNVKLLFTGWEAWVVSIGMITVAVAAKYSAADLSGKVLRFRREEILLIFGLTVNQAAATLAAVLIGFELGLFTENIITGTILMIAVTCVVGSIVTDYAGRRVALHEQLTEVSSASYQNRIMIPMGGREGAKELLDISFLLRERGSQEPIYPLRVVEEGGDSDKQVIAAERILAHSVVRAMAAAVPVMPITSVDINVLSGILRSIKDYRISTLVLGWDGKVGVKTRVYGHIIDTVVERSRQMIIINRFTQRINSVNRLVVVLPPFAHREVGFDQFTSVVRNLSSQAAASLLFICDCGTQGAAQELLDHMKSSLKTEFASYPSWKEVQSVVSSLLKADDWLLLMSVRKGEIAWQPTLDRLPQQMASAFPEAPFSVIVSPTEKWVYMKTPETTSRIFNIFPKERILLSIETESSRDVIHRLVSTYLADNKENESLVMELYKMGQNEPVELVQDVVFLHTYVKNLKETMSFLGVTSRPLDIPLASGAPHVVIILLDPEGQDPAKHLESLANIAKLIRIPDVVTLLRQSLDFEALVQSIADRE